MQDSFLRKLSHMTDFVFVCLTIMTLFFMPADSRLLPKSQKTTTATLGGHQFNKVSEKSLLLAAPLDLLDTSTFSSAPRIQRCKNVPTRKKELRAPAPDLSPESQRRYRRNPRGDIAGIPEEMSPEYQKRYRRQRLSQPLDQTRTQNMPAFNIELSQT
ncbi:unnamed protein product [Cyprideis torosa]|uniref:Uncharacterized protein n=1 Tax=Cyprideis torosa TaxID=163714 RepID=A0A7R8W1C3_9CRUS|nr:unnamed protein product [Cyprideis torosa]CAG0879645.1 unnamed protein product [Cyprideis torosa]